MLNEGNALKRDLSAKNSINLEKLDEERSKIENELARRYKELEELKKHFPWDSNSSFIPDMMILSTEIEKVIKGLDNSLHLKTLFRIF